MAKFGLVRDKVPYLLEKWERNVEWKSVKEKSYLHPGLYTSKIRQEFYKLMASFGDDNTYKTEEQMAELLELFEGYTSNCMRIDFSDVIKLKEEKAEREGKYNDQVLLWE